MMTAARHEPPTFIHIKSLFQEAPRPQGQIFSPPPLSTGHPLLAQTVPARMAWPWPPHQQLYSQPVVPPSSPWDPSVMMALPPHHVLPARLSPRPDGLSTLEDDTVSVHSDPGRRNIAEGGGVKRDSCSDSESSESNTPTKGRTITEGLLRMVHDNSINQNKPQEAQRRVVSVIQAAGQPPQMYPGEWRVHPPTEMTYK